MPQFILKIEMGTEGMQTTKDIADALNEITRDLKTRQWLCSHPDAGGRIDIRDINGNAVGYYEVV